MKKKMNGWKILLITVGSVILGIAVLFGFFVLLLYMDDCQANSEKSARERITDTTGKNTEFEEKFRKAEPFWLKEKVDVVSSEYYPDFEDPYYWLKTKDLTLNYLTIYFIYEPQSFSRKSTSILSRLFC